MGSGLNPWLALLLGILIGWLLEWLVELFYFRGQRLECQRRLTAVEGQLRARDAELDKARMRAAELEAELRAATEVKWPEVSAAVSAAAVEPPAVPVASIGAELPEVKAGLPEAALPAVAAAQPEVAAAQPEVAAAQPEVAAAQPALAAVPPAAGADDLTIIRGIGPKYAATLRAAGITSFAALAAATPESLAAIIRAPDWRKADYGAWIAEAATLVSAPRAVQAGDDLEVIVGIGPVYAGMLRAAGITTFAQLAAATEARLAEIIQAPAWRGLDYADWIAQAKALAEGR